MYKMVILISYASLFLWTPLLVLTGRDCFMRKLHGNRLFCINLTIPAEISVALLHSSLSYENIDVIVLMNVTGGVNFMTFRKFPKLRSLRIGESIIHTFEPNVPTLENLEISDSFVTLTNFDKCCKNLEKLSLKNSTGIQIENGEFNSLNHLKKLQLTQQNITHFTNKTFRGLSSLKKLRIKDVGLEIIANDAFIGIKNLKELYLEDNNIETINDLVFKPLRNLTTLTIYGSKLKPLSVNMFTEQINLNQLGLPINTWRIVDVEKIPNMFPKLYAISYIGLHGHADKAQLIKKFNTINLMILYKN